MSIMRTVVRLLLWFVLLLAGSVYASDHDDQAEMRRLRASGVIVPLEQLVSDARQRHPGRMLEAELKKRDDRYIYEVEMLDEAGLVRELIYDAASGRLLEERKDD